MEINQVTTIQGNKNASKIKIWFDEFLQGQWFILFCALLSAFSWSFHIEYITYILVGILSTYVFFSQKSIKPVVTMFAYVITCYSGQGNYTYLHFVFYLACGIFLVTSIIYRFYMLFISRTKFKIGKLFVPMLIASFGVLLGGIGSSEYEMMNLPIVFGISLMFVFLYVIVTNFMNEDLRGYICKIMIGASLICLIEMIVWYLNCPDITKAFGEKSLDLAWINANGIGLIFVMTMTLALYKACRNTKNMIFYLVISGFCMIALIFTFSRGAILCSILFLITSWIYGYNVSTSKKKYMGTSLLSFVFIILVCTITFITFPQIFTLYKQKGLSDNGRFDMYRLALKSIFENPLFGVGFRTRDTIGNVVKWKVYDSILQVLFSTGIIGFILISYFVYSRIKIQAEYFSKFKLFATLSILAFDFYSLFENMFTSVPLNIFILLIVIACEKETDYAKNLSIQMKKEKENV